MISVSRGRVLRKPFVNRQDLKVYWGKTKDVLVKVAATVHVGLGKLGVWTGISRRDLIASSVGALIAIVSLRLITEPQIQSQPAVLEAPVVPVSETLAAVETTVSTVLYQDEAEELAKVLYGMARNHSELDQTAVCWCVINRVESSIYPNTVREVCRQPSQWVGYSPESPVLESLYNVALEVLTSWHNGGHRPVDPSYLWLNWSPESIKPINQF